MPGIYSDLSQTSDSNHFPDDADANLGDNGAGSLLFMARTCVGENVGDFCSTGVKEGQAVTVCRSVMAHGWNINMRHET